MGDDTEHEDEIYQNYTASEVVLQGFEKTNEMLSNVNSLSAVRLDRANKDFRKHTQNMLEMKRDLDTIFRRLKTIKQKMNRQMPEAYEAVLGGAKDVVKEEDDEYDIAIKERKLQEQLSAISLDKQSDKTSDNSN